MVSLVTGVAGFLGRAVADCLQREGHSVRGLVRHEDQADALRSRGMEAVIGDVRQLAGVKAAVRDVDVVYHCAAAHAADTTRGEIFAVNREGTRNVAQALRAAGCGRLVFVSGINVLGTRNFHGPTEDWPRRRENDVLAQAKIEAEQLLLDYHRRYALDIVIVRLPLIYGPADTRNIPKLMGAIRRGKFTYIGGRDNIIPLVHVEDAARALLLAGAAAGAAGRVYHISDGANVTIRELAEHLAELMGCPPPSKKLPYFVPYAACMAFQWLRCFGLTSGAGPIDRVTLRFLGTSRPVDITRATRELGYRPKVTFREGLAATVKWFREHGDE
jgi:2-alkyl-3-oxoalkanoate reductase